MYTLMSTVSTDSNLIEIIFLKLLLMYNKIYLLAAIGAISFGEYVAVAAYGPNCAPLLLKKLLAVSMRKFQWWSEKLHPFQFYLLVH